MKALQFSFILAAFILSGCVVRTYQMTRDRVDQDVSGNRGYLKGQAPAEEGTTDKKMTRVTQIFEIELHSPIKFDRLSPQEKPVSPEVKPEGEAEVFSEEAEADKQMREGLSGNRGFLSEAITPEIQEPGAAHTEKYKVQKGDTLQKISRKFYGTTGKWTRIYDANKEILKTPNSIYPGQVIDIPEALKETEENFK